VEGEALIVAAAQAAGQAAGQATVVVVEWPVEAEEAITRATGRIRQDQRFECITQRPRRDGEKLPRATVRGDGRNDNQLCSSGVEAIDNAR
jgi:hypothetical protein